MRIHEIIISNHSLDIKPRGSSPKKSFMDGFYKWSIPTVVAFVFLYIGVTICLDPILKILISKPVDVSISHLEKAIVKMDERLQQAMNSVAEKQQLAEQHIEKIREKAIGAAKDAVPQIHSAKFASNVVVQGQGDQIINEKPTKIKLKWQDRRRLVLVTASGIVVDGDKREGKPEANPELIFVDQDGKQLGSANWYWQSSLKEPVPFSFAGFVRADVGVSTVRLQCKVGNRGGATIDLRFTHLSLEVVEWPVDAE